MPLSLDEIAAAAEARRQEQQRQTVAAMSDEIGRIRAEDWQPPEDVEYVPEQAAPADWWVREQLAKARAKGHLADEQPEPDSQPWFTIEGED